MHESLGNPCWELSETHVIIQESFSQATVGYTNNQGHSNNNGIVVLSKLISYRSNEPFLAEFKANIPVESIVEGNGALCVFWVAIGVLLYSGSIELKTRKGCKFGC